MPNQDDRQTGSISAISHFLNAEYNLLSQDIWNFFEICQINLANLTSFEQVDDMLTALRILVRKYPINKFAADAKRREMDKFLNQTIVCKLVRVEDALFKDPVSHDLIPLTMRAMHENELMKQLYGHILEGAISKIKEGLVGQGSTNDTNSTLPDSGDFRQLNQPCDEYLNSTKARIVLYPDYSRYLLILSHTNSPLTTISLHSLAWKRWLIFMKI